jgi:hypothetical protein
MDISTEEDTSKKEQEIWNKIINDLGKKDFKSMPDDIIQSVANVLGLSIDLQTIDNNRAFLYIDTIKKWLQISTNGTIATEGKRYKIMAKFLEIAIPKKKKVSKEKLERLRKDIVNAFITRPISLMQNQNLQQLSKVTGLFFSDNTISAIGKQKVFDLVQNQIKRNQQTTPTLDPFSLQKLKEYNHQYQEITTTEEEKGKKIGKNATLKKRRICKNWNIKIIRDRKEKVY